MSRSVRISDEIVEDGAGDSPFIATAPPKDGDVVEDDQVSEESHPLLHAAASYHRKGLYCYVHKRLSAAKYAH